YMGIGPVPAVHAALDRAKLSLRDLDVIEVNEAFAAQALAVARELGLPDDRTNPNGSGISLGHPIGATGCILTVKALHELERTGGRYALVTMCIGAARASRRSTSGCDPPVSWTSCRAAGSRVTTSRAPWPSSTSGDSSPATASRSTTTSS